MKLKYGFILLALCAGVIFWPVQQAAWAQAGDELVVEWETSPGSGEPLVNALRDAIANDTNRPEGRVYKLRKGGFYWNSERIENNGFHLRIVGEDPGPTALENPALIQMVARTDGTVDGRAITGLSSVTLKNLWLTGRDDNGVQTYYQPFQMDASDSRFVIDNCVLEQTNFAPIAFTGKNNDISYTNCKFRNLVGQPSTQQWEGRGISIWADQDTVIVENCTFFNIGMTPFQLEGGAAKYIRFNHNTIVNSGRQITTGNWFREAYFVNNLCINVWWHGEGAGDLANPNRDPRQIHGGLFNIGALPSQYGPEQGRRIVFANTAAYLDPKFITSYGDTIRRAQFVDPVTRLDFLDKYGPAMAAIDTTWLSALPAGFTYPPADPNWTTGSPGTTMIDSMILNITKLRAGITPATPYYYKPTEFPTDVSWPLPENFAYTEASLLTSGTDGLPLGDLNWFPTQKAQWEANKDKNIADIEALGGPKRRLTIVGRFEAEAGALAGDATVVDYTGPLPYFHMEGGGFIRWTFEMQTAATVDLVITTRSNDARRGQHVRVNGTGLRNDTGFGEYSWYDLDPVVWKSYTITQASLVNNTGDALNLPAGQNTIEIAPSWGYQEFLSVDVIAGGNLVAALNASNATEYEIVTLVSPGGPPPPSGFKTVALGTNGGITWAFNAEADGNYLLNVFYQAPAGTQTGQIQVDGQNATSVELAGVVGDSSIVSSLSGVFPMTAGSHSVTLSGGQYIADFVQIIKEDFTSAVAGRKELPLGYALAQNYPNPFNPTTTINFALGKASQVKLTVYNVLGQKVVTLLDQRMNAGPHIVSFDASNLTSGVYFYRLEAGDFLSQKRMLLIK